MTRKIAISVPDDVAERLSHEPNVSAFVTDAVRRRMVSEQARDMHVAAGLPLTEEGLAWAREQWATSEAAKTPELYAEALDRFGDLIKRRAGHG